MTTIQKYYLPPSATKSNPLSIKYKQVKGATSWEIPNAFTLKRSITPYSFEWLQTHKAPETFSERFARLQKAVVISNANKAPDALGALYLLSPVEARFADADALDFLKTVGKTHYIVLDTFDSLFSIRKAKQKLGSHSENTLIIAAHGNNDGIALPEQQAYTDPDPTDFENFDSNGSICLLSCGSMHIGEKLRALLETRKETFQGTLYGSTIYYPLKAALIYKNNQFHMFQSDGSFKNLIEKTETIKKEEIEFYLKKRIKSLTEIAINQKDSQLLIELSTIYAEEDGVQKSEKRALQLLEKAADFGNGDAAYSAASMYYYGIGCQSSHSKAFELFQQSAALENKQALFSLAMMYSAGEGCERSLEKELEYLKRGMKLNDPNAFFRLGLLLSKENSLQHLCELTPIECYQKAAEMDHPEAALQLGRCYSCGQDVLQSPELAYHYLNQAQALGHPEAARVIQAFLTLFPTAKTSSNQLKENDSHDY